MEGEGTKADLSKLRIESRSLPPVEGSSSWGLLMTFLVLFCLALCGVSVWLWIRYENLFQVVQRQESESSKQQSGKITAEQSAAPKVAAVPAVRSLAATGYVVAQRMAAVSSKATGRLRELAVREGDRVIAGQVIGVLENDDLLALQKQADAAVIAAQAQIKSAEADLAEARRKRERMLSLSRQKVVPVAEFDSVDAQLDRAQAQLSLAQANLLVVMAQAEKARVDLEYTRVRAPFDGTVLTKNADIGEIVSPFGSSADSRAAIVTIADMTSLEVEADVSEENIGLVVVGQNVDIVLDSFPDRKYKGRVSNIVPTVDRAKATVKCRIQFLNLDERVLPEMSAKIEFEVVSPGV